MCLFSNYKHNLYVNPGLAYRCFMAAATDVWTRFSTDAIDRGISSTSVDGDVGTPGNSHAVITGPPCSSRSSGSHGEEVHAAARVMQIRTVLNSRKSACGEGGRGQSNFLICIKLPFHKHVMTEQHWLMSVSRDSQSASLGQTECWSSPPSLSHLGGRGKEKERELNCIWLVFTKWVEL